MERLKLTLNMSRDVVVGGCGIVGSVAVRTLACFDDSDEIFIADINGGNPT